jgi:DNA-binding CsgD family transcriptional regulator
MALYLAKYQEHNLWNQAGLEQQVFFDGNVVIGDEMVPRATLLESKYYKEWLAQDPHTGQMLGGIIFGIDAAHSMPAVCALMRGLNETLVSQIEREKMQLILPHISRSLGVMQRLRCAELTVACTLSALNNLPSGVLLMAHDGSVAFANHAAQRMLEEADGLSLRKLTQGSGLGNLIAANAQANHAIQQEINTALNPQLYTPTHFSKSVVIARTSGKANFSLQFSTLGNQLEFGAGNNDFAAVIFIEDGLHRVAIDPAVLQSGFKLTPAEARVAVSLLEFGSAKEVAQFLGVRESTVRSQIKQVYLKMCVDTRARFIKLMLSLSHQVI